MYLFSNIKFLRKQANMTQEEFGVLLDKSLQTVSGYERGSSEPDINSLLTISRHFKIPIHDLIVIDLSKNENYENAIVAEPPPQYEKGKELPAAISEDAVLRKQVELLMTEVKRLNQKIDLIEERLKRLK